MRFQPELSTYPHGPQRKKKNQKERNDYDYAFNLLNPEGTIHVLLKGDILTSYEQLLLQRTENRTEKNYPADDKSKLSKAI